MTQIDKEAFASAIVHDMRAPLNACVMSLSLLELKASQPAEVLKAVEVIRRNLARQALLVQDLTDALQMIGSELRLEIATADLAEITEQAAEALATAAGVKVHWADGRPAGLLIPADAERLARAIGTLLEIVAPDRQAAAEAVEVTTTNANGRVRLEMRRRETSAGAEGAGAAVGGTSTAAPADRAGSDAPRVRRKEPVMRLTVATEIIEKHGGRVEVQEQRAAVELPLR